MTNISKNALTPLQLDKLMNQFHKTLAKITKKSSPYFVHEFFGTEEKIMFAKRLGAIALCVKGTSSYTIWRTLKISPITALKIRDKYNRGAYTHIEHILKKNTHDFARFLDLLETILSAGMPPRGEGRWKNVTRLLREK